MLTLAVLLGCRALESGPDHRKADSADTGDTGAMVDSADTSESADTADSGAVDSGDTGESGDTDTADTALPPEPKWLWVSVGDYHSCGVRVDGTLSCWGLNNEGQCDAPAGVFVAVDSTFYGSCALDAGGDIACWGEYTAPVSGGPWAQVDCTAGCVALGVDGHLETFDTGEPYNGYSYHHYPALYSVGPYVQIVAGDYAAGICARDSAGTVSCWDALSVEPTEVPSGTFVDVGAGLDFACALDAAGSTTCWGNEADFDCYFDFHTVPAGAFVDIVVNGCSVCGLDATGAATCWGELPYWDPGGLSDTPTDLFAQVSVGWDHACGVTLEGQAVCWGSNGAGKSTPPE